MAPMTLLPSPYVPRITRPSFERFVEILDIAPFSVSAGRCSITEARMPVPRFVGHWVR